jgi:DNA-binding transcriptional regulator LsrR (DeoR family)
MRDYDTLNENEKLFLLSEVASLYYNHNMTQSEIANRIFTSRSKISRLLKEAKDKGVVEIKINEPWERALHLEDKLIKIFNLKDVRVLNSKNSSNSEILSKLGRLGAYYLENVIDKNTILGVSWGKTIFNTINSLSSNKNIPLTVVQIMGAASKNNPEIDAIDLTRRIAQTYGGKYHYLYAPLYVDDIKSKETLIKDPAIADTLNLAKHANIILTGLGTVDTESETTLWRGYLNSYTQHNLKAKGAVGHICAHFIDINGNKIDLDIDKKLIGLELEDLKNIDNVICIASGESKAKALLGALRGGYIKTLITDDKTISKLLQYENNY